MTEGSLLQRLRQRIGGSRTVELPASCYGKLPIYKDFLREKLAGKEAQAFKQWLDRGISHFWSARDETRGTQIEPHAFLLRFPGTGKHLVGYLWGSHDEGGLRFFPFSVFVAVPAGREGPTSLSVLAVLTSVLEAGKAWRQQARGLQSLQDFKAWCQQLKLKVEMSPDREVVKEVLTRAESITVDEYASSLWSDGSELEWPALLAYLDRHRMRASTQPHHAELAARFPSSGRVTSVCQAQFLNLLLRQYESRHDRHFQLLLPATHSPLGITVFVRNLRPEDVIAFHPDLTTYEHLEDLRTTVPRWGDDQVVSLTESEKSQPLRATLDPGYTPPSHANRQEN